jgi:cation diffusion facilitator family transporter
MTDPREAGGRRTPMSGRVTVAAADDRVRGSAALPAGQREPGFEYGLAAERGRSDSVLTVFLALGANVLIAVAKSVAAAVTGSASLAAETAHSWADTGNEVFLVVANRRSARPADHAHPFGHGREAYVWSLFAAIGLFVAGGAVSVTHGIAELRAPTPADHFVAGYVVLALSFVLEGTSFVNSYRQATAEAQRLHRDLVEHLLATSDPTLRAVFAEDAAALIGLVIAAGGLAAHQVTGSAVPDAIGSILVGLLLTVVAFVLVNRNRRFLVGQEADPRVHAAVLRLLLDQPEIARVTRLRLEVVGPRVISVVGAVDLTGEDVESRVAVRLRALEAKISSSPAVAGALLGLSAPDEPDLTA